MALAGGLSAFVLAACGRGAGFDGDAGTDAGSGSDVGTSAGADGGTSTEKLDSWPAQEALAALAPDDITAITYALSGEGGVERGELDSPEAVADVRELLLGLEAGSATTEAFSDAGLRIVVETVDAERLAFEFEGDVLVLEDGRYEVSGLGPLESYLSGEE